MKFSYRMTLAMTLVLGISTMFAIGQQAPARGGAQGDIDEAVPVTNTRMWVDTMKELKLDYEYKEYPGLTHGPIIDGSMPDIFAYFAKHTKAGRK